jgi:hypothetical protein
MVRELHETRSRGEVAKELENNIQKLGKKLRNKAGPGYRSWAEHDK